MSDDSRYPFAYRHPKIPAPGVRGPLGAHAIILEADHQGRFLGYQHFGRLMTTTAKWACIDVDGQQYQSPWHNLFLQAIGPELEDFELLLDRVSQVRGITERLQASHPHVDPGLRALLLRTEELKVLAEILQTK